MNLLHICCNLAGSTVFPQLFTALKAAGLEQTVFVPEKREGDMGKNLPEGVLTHYRLTVKKSDTIFFFRKAQRSVPEIEKLVPMEKTDLIHAHTLFTDGSIAYALHKKYSTPFAVTLRYSDMAAIWRYMPHLRPMARRILRSAARVVFLSEKARDNVLLTWLGEKDREKIAPKCAVIPNGIDPAWLDGQGKDAPHTPVTVGFAGLLNNRKRPLDALAAVHKAADSGLSCRMLACGSGPLEMQFKSAMRAEDAFLGRVSGMDAMKAFYSKCDVLLVPSEAETFGMVYLEAMSQGVPVLYTRGQGFDGQFPEGAVGYSVACGDVNEQAARIAQTLDGYADRSARCVQLAKGYAWPVVAARWMNLYTDALA